MKFEAISGSPRGYYELRTCRIVIDQQLAVNAQVKTLVHELAHALLRAEPPADGFTLEHAVEELVVESVAYTVCGALGLDTAGYSIPYLASWAQDHDLKILEQTAALIDRLARRIEDAALPDDSSRSHGTHPDAAESPVASAAGRC